MHTAGGGWSLPGAGAAHWGHCGGVLGDGYMAAAGDVAGSAVAAPARQDRKSVV